jgi:hypothetical protein
MVSLLGNCLVRLETCDLRQQDDLPRATLNRSRYCRQSAIEGAAMPRMWKETLLAGTLIISAVTAVFGFQLFKPIPAELSIQSARAYGPLSNGQSPDHYDIAIEFTYEKKGDGGIYCRPQININSQIYTGTILYEPTGYFWADSGTKHGRSVAGISPEITAYSPGAGFRLQCNGFASPWTKLAIPRLTVDVHAQ